MRHHLRAAARALRDFLRGFTGIAQVRAAANEPDDGSQRPFCC